MKKALVLSGGGSKGAYEAGCIKALHELNETFDIVTGTSIGALNGLLYVQQDFDEIESLWKNMKMSDVMKEPIDLSIDGLLNQSNLIWPFFKSYINEKGADITPLKQLVASLFNKQKFQQSKIDYGIVTVQYPKLKPLEITKKDMKNEDAYHYALASASCFPAFPVYKYKGKEYIDGGYYDNTPISLALELGADEVVVIELSPDITHSYFFNRPNITYIRPYSSLGKFLDFDRDLLDKRMMMGYLDTMKIYHQLDGFQYSFYSKKIKKDFILAYYQQILTYENNYHKLSFTQLLTNEIPLTSILKDYSHKEVLDYEDYFLSGLELTMQYFSYPVTIIYDKQEILSSIHNSFLQEYKQDPIMIKGLFLNKKEQDKLKELPSIELLSFIYSNLEKDGHLDPMLPFMMFSKEILIAMFLYTIKKQY